MTLSLAQLEYLFQQIVDWHGFISQMLAQLATQPPQQAGLQAQQVLLCLFKTLPEELYSRKLKVGENRRVEVEQELAAHTEQVLVTLVSVKNREMALMAPLQSKLCAASGAEENGGGILTKAVHCLSSWLLNKRCPTETV
jgi:hypothetical protein